MVDAAEQLTTVLLAGGANARYVTEVLAVARELGSSIVLVTTPGQLIPKDVIPAPAGRSVFASFAAGLSKCATPEVLVCATDLPNLASKASSESAEMTLADLIESARRTGADLVVCLADLSSLGDDYRQVSRHPVILNGSRYKFGGVVWLKRTVSDRLLTIARDILPYKKNPLRLALQLLKYHWSWCAVGAVIRYALSYLMFRQFSWLSLTTREAKQLALELVGIRLDILKVPLKYALDDDR